MQFYAVVFAFLAASWTQGGDASKCDQAVLFRLQELYHKYNKVPTDIVATNIKLSPDIAVATTDGYFDNQEDISCVSTSWSVDGTFTTTFVYDTLETLTTTPGKPVQELPGQTYNADTKDHRFHIPTGPLVGAFYKCQEDGEQGPAEGLVKVWSGYDLAAYEGAVKDLEYVLGNELSQTFPDTCVV